jgi:hypothetical protein
LRYLVLIILFCISFKSESQNTEGGLFINQIKATVNSNGFLFDSLGNSGLKTKNGFPLSVGAGIWMSANDSLGNLRVAAHNVLGNNHDFWAGPLELISGNAPNPSLWNKVYTVNKNEVDFHLLNYKKSNYQMSENIKMWPGSAPYPYAKTLAPFVDLNDNNQIYEPNKGDYPFFKGDAIVYSIYNDNYTNHSYSNALPIGVEVHTSMFGFNTQSVLDNCIIVRHVLFNRSGRDYQNFRFSNVINFKIGNIFNEFLGTDIKNNCLFAINDTTEATFSNRLVSLGCMALNKGISSTMYFNNDNDMINGKPTLPEHFKSLMAGKWKNKKSLSYGSNGVDGSFDTKFVYPYDTDDKNLNLMWNEESVGNTSGQRIGVMNFDSVQLKSNNVIYYDFVYFFVDENYKNIKQLEFLCLSIKNELNRLNVLKINQDLLTRKLEVIMSPNPLKKGEQLLVLKNDDMPCFVSVVDMQGKEIYKFYLEKNKESVKLPDYLQSGIYFLNFQTLNNKHTSKLIIN